MQKEYGIIYCQVCLPETHGMSWLRWCNSPNILPDFFKKELFSTIESLNQKWKDELIIELDKSPLTTCLTKTGKTEEIAYDIYLHLNDLIKKYSEIEDNIRIVWTESSLPESREEMPSAHMLGNFPGPIRVGTFLQSDNEVGVFKV